MKLPTNKQITAAASKQYDSDDINVVESKRNTSRADTGAWVKAWVWVYYTDIPGFEDFDDDPDNE
jgi:hypothetical protein